jgi:hypothetical protein
MLFKTVVDTPCCISHLYPRSVEEGHGGIVMSVSQVLISNLEIVRPFVGIRIARHPQIIKTLTIISKLSFSLQV